MVICCIWIPSSTGSRQSAFQTAVRNETGGWEQMIISGQRLQAESRAAGDTRPQCGVKAAVRLKRCKCEVQSINWSTDWGFLDEAFEASSEGQSDYRKTWHRNGWRALDVCMLCMSDALLVPWHRNSMLWILTSVCSAAAQLPAPHSPIPLYVPNPLSPPAADKEECIAAFTLCSSGRWKIPCSCTLLACIISTEPFSIQLHWPFLRVCVSVCFTSLCFVEWFVLTVLPWPATMVTLSSLVHCTHTHNASAGLSPSLIAVLVDKKPRGYKKGIIRELANQ